MCVYFPAGEQQQPSIDKEVAAHLLLDLSKTQQEGETEDQQAARIIAIETARNVVDLTHAQTPGAASAGQAAGKPGGGSHAAAAAETPESSPTTSRGHQRR